MTFLLALLLFHERGRAEKLIGSERGGGNWFDSKVFEPKKNYSIGECSERLYGGPGFIQYHKNIEGNKNICINITSYRFFIVWANYPLDTEVTYYHSFPGDTTLIEENTSYAPDLPLYTEISTPFASITINLPHGGYIAFSYGSSPNMCKTGMMISNTLAYHGEFNDHTKGFEKIDYYEDKCLLFVSQSTVNVTFDSNFNGDSQRIVVYQDIADPKSIIDYKHTFAQLDTTKNPILIRIFTQHKNSVLSLDVSSGAIHPTKEETAIFTPPLSNACPKPVECNLWHFVSPDMLFVCVIFSIILLLIIIAAIYVLLAWKCPKVVGIEENGQDVDSTPFASTSALLEARTEPAGYFAMDQYLRPQEE